MKKIILVILVLCSTLAFSQNEVNTENLNFNDAGPNKGKIFVYWGWNRDHYSTSDIKFRGADYRFTLYDVKADDKPKPFGIYFLKLDELTIPQTNFRIGYFLKEHYTVSIGLDHMKYVMRNDQTVRMNGVINTGVLLTVFIIIQIRF